MLLQARIHRCDAGPTLPGIQGTEVAQALRQRHVVAQREEDAQPFHHFPGAARQGFAWWEVDLTYYGLRALAALGLVWDLKPVPANLRRGVA